MRCLHAFHPEFPFRINAFWQEFGLVTIAHFGDKSVCCCQNTPSGLMLELSDAPTPADFRLESRVLGSNSYGYPHLARQTPQMGVTRAGKSQSRYIRVGLYLQDVETEIMTVHVFSSLRILPTHWRCGLTLARRL